MAFAPIAFVIPEYDRTLYANWWLKAYEPGTTTPKAMATDQTGSSTASRYELNTEGFPITAGGAFVVPHVDGDYDLWLFPTAAEADANDTANALQFADNLGIVSLIQSVSNTSSEVVLSADTVADLKTKDLQSGQTISTKGYHTAGDGGGAKYLIQTAAEFGGTPDGYGDHTLTNGNVAVLDVAGRVTAKQYGLTGLGTETAALSALLNSRYPIDLEGLTISSDQVSVNNENIDIISSNSKGRLIFVGAADTEFFVKLNIATASGYIYIEETVIDSSNNAAKGLFVEVDSLVIADKFYLNRVESINCQQTASTGLTAGIFLFGGFARFETHGVIIDEINSTGGSLVASGIRTGSNGASECLAISINGGKISNVTPGDDGDGVALLQTFPFANFGVYEVNDVSFENCHKRAIKTQCWKSIVRTPYIVRTEAHNAANGNTEIDCQYGNAEIIDPVFDYSNDTTAPQFGLISLFGERGEQADNVGRSVNVTGGTCTIRSQASPLPYLFTIESFVADDVCNRPSVRGFKFNGEADHACQIRPVASATFQRNVVFDPSFANCEFEQINQSFFTIDRSGAGYAYTSNANVTDCLIRSGVIPLEILETSDVGISYLLLSGNRNLRNNDNPLFDVQTNVADTTSANFSFKMPLNASAEVTAFYASSAGNNYHAHRKSIIHAGNGAGEETEVMLHNQGSSFGGWTFTIVPVISGGVCTVTVTKPTGASVVTGTFSVSAVCPQGFIE